MLKKTAFALLYLVMAAMGAATFVEKFHGTAFARLHVYGSAWFVLLWTALALTSVAYLVRRRVRRASVVALHASFVLILIGALLSHLLSVRGSIHLRTGETASTFTADDGRGGTTTARLPFALRLDTFRVVCHEGTDAPADYVSHLTLTDGGRSLPARVSMNRIFTYASTRLYQASYDADGRGSVLAVNRDPWGTGVTYAGYALLFASLLWMLLDPRGRFRRLLRHPLLRGGLVALALVALPCAARSATVLPEQTAARMGRLYVEYGGRICPLQTLALDFTRKIHGSDSYGGHTAEQVLLSWVFWSDEWDAEPVIRVKSRALRQLVGLDEYVPFRTFFTGRGGSYLLGPLVMQYYAGQRDELHKAAAEVDDKLQLVFALRRGTLFRVFPHTAGGRTRWYAPTEALPAGMERPCSLFVRGAFNRLNAEAGRADFASFEATVAQLAAFQRQYGGRSLPSPAAVRAERAYNALPSLAWLWRLDLAAGLATLVFALWQLAGRRAGRRLAAAVRYGSAGLLTLSLAWLSVLLVLRGIVSGRVPMSNGYETMLLLAWCTQLVALAFCRRVRLLAPFGLLLSGFFLLVSSLGMMDPQMSPMMPVLASPLLSVHVSLVMMSFALLAFTFLCGVAGLLVPALGRDRAAGHRQAEALRVLSQLFLYPAMALLGAGIFTGAIWANVSWGSYWSWDAKEVWALVAFLFYAVALHDASLPFLRSPRSYHWYMVAAFSTVLMTYFGVNYYLGGLHSYA